MKKIKQWKNFGKVFEAAEDEHTLNKKTHSFEWVFYYLISIVYD